MGVRVNPPPEMRRRARVGAIAGGSRRPAEPIDRERAHERHCHLSRSRRPACARASSKVAVVPFAFLCSNVSTDFRSRRVRYRKQPVDLTKLEFDILAYRSQTPAQLSPDRKWWMLAVWYTDIRNLRRLDVNISSLRRKLGN